ncbi:MAG: type II secretion system protein [Planctomycetes bacterium]|nr:type II secretion system protein [Planctomycetota bacterium]
MTHAKANSRQNGYTFVELCLVFLIIGTVASASFGGMAAESHQTRVFDEETTASALACRILERARAGDYVERALSTGSPQACPIDGPARSLAGCKATLSALRVEWAQGMPSLVELRAVITWRSAASGGASSYELATWIRWADR